MDIGERFVPSGLFLGIYIPTCILQSTELTPTDKLVWACLNQYAGQDGCCYPKQTTLAKDIGCSERTIRNSLNALEEHGFIEKEVPTGVDRLKHLNNKYYFIWHEAYNTNLRTGKKCLPGTETISGANKIHHNKEIKHRLSTGVETFLELFPKPYQENPTFVKTWTKFAEDRKTRKIPLTANAVKIVVGKIRKQCRTDIQRAVDGLNASIEKGYRGVFFNESTKQSSAKQMDLQYTPAPKRRGPRVGCDPHERY